MKSRSVGQLIIVLTIFLLASPAIIPQAKSVSSGPRLGFWLQDSNIYAYSAQTFFNTMFLTPPYPSSVEVMIFAIQQDQTNGNGCSATTPYVKQSIDYWGQVAQLADSYQSIRLIFQIAFDPSSGGSGIYGLSCYNAIVQALGQHPSVYGIGVEGEYTTVGQGMTEAEMVTAMDDVTALGKLFVNYYPPVPIPAGGYDIAHTNFPGGDSGGYDQVGTLRDSDSQTIGLDSGYYANYQFPGTVSCPIGPSAMSASTAGWNQCVISTEFGTAVSFSPSSARQFLEIDVGFSSSGSFIGVSGKSTTQLWDNPTLRNWLWTDSNYQSNFVLSTSVTVTTTTTSPTITSTTTSTTSTTKSTSTTSTTPTTSTTSTSTSSVSTTSSIVTVSTDSSSYQPGSYVYWSATGLNPSIIYSPKLALIFNNGTEIKINGANFNPILSGTSSGNFQIPSYNALNAGFVKIEDPSAKTVGLSLAFMVGSATTTTTTTSSSSSTSAGSTTTSSASTSTTQTTSQPTSTVTSTHSGVTGYALSVLGGCSSAGAGSYAAGSMATVQFTGVCGRGGGSGLRVTSWSIDGGTRTTIHTNGSSSISVAMDGPHTVNLYTIPQYQLSLDFGAQSSLLSITPTSVPSDNYWYDSGTTVTYIGGVELPTFNIAGWALDGANAVPVSGVSTFTSTFTMSQQHDLVAFVSLKTTPCGSSNCTKTPTFDVTIQTNTNLPSGVWVDGGYYPKSVTFAWQASSVHNVTAAEGGRRPLVRTSFIGWSGLSDSHSYTVMLTANKSGVLTSDYTNSYLVVLAFVDRNSQPLTPQSVTLKGPSGSQVLGSNLTVWAEAGSQYRITSAIWMNWDVSMANDSSFKVNQPADLTFSTNVYPETLKVADAYNLPLQGAAINVTTLNGLSFSASTNSQGLAQFRVPVGIYTANIGYLGVSDQITFAAQGSHNYTVTFLLSYPLLATIGSVSAIAAAFSILRIRRSKTRNGPQFFLDER